MHEAGDRLAAPWEPLSILLDEPARLEARVSTVRRALAERAGLPESAVDGRVAASVTHLGLVARLVAVSIGAAALGREGLGGEGLRLEPDAILWQDVLGGPVPLSCPLGPRPGAAVPPAAAALSAAVMATYQLSGRVAWGNVASAANSAASMIGHARPDLSAAAILAADRVLADPRVENGVTRAGPDFRRRSCCLIYRIDPSRRSVCGDCILRAEPA